MRNIDPTPRVVLLLAVLMGALLPTSLAHASEFRMYGGLGAGLMLSEDQLGYLGYDGIAGRGWFTAGNAFSELWIVEGHVSTNAFGSSGRDGGLTELGGGIRFDFLTPMHTMRLSPAAHLNLGLTGSNVRPTVSASVGLYLDLSPAWALGPSVQYGQVFQPDGEQYSSDARYFTVGISLGYRPAPELAPAASGPRRVPAAHELTVNGGPSDEPPVDVADTPPSPELLVLIESAVGSSGEEDTLIPPVLFEHDSVDFIPCGEAALFYARDAINGRKEPVTLEGHADTTGELAYNVELAQRRAEVVRAWLIAHGVPEERLALESHGEKDGLTPETDDSRRQINRRVVIRFEKKAQPHATP